MDYFQNKKICITGIGGFIGNRLAELLAERGAIITGIEIRPDKAKELEKKGFFVYIGSTEDPQLLEKSLKGCDFVLHTAALVQEGGKLEEFRKINVEASVAIAQIAKRLGVRAMVHFSSVMVYGFTYPDFITEDGELRGENNPYCITKIEGEKELQKVMDSKFGIIYIRPGDVYGPFSMPWVVRPLELMKKGLFALPDDGKGKINLTYIDNLVHGVCLALEQNTFGEAFNITDGETLTWKDYFSMLAEAGGHTPPLLLPTLLLKGLVHSLGFAHSLVGSEPPVREEGVNFLLRKNQVSIEKARTKLSYNPKVSMSEGIRKTMDWVSSTYKVKV